METNTEEHAQLEYLESVIPPEIRRRYTDMYATNLWLDQQLMLMAAKGILHHVVLGQDDAQHYGMANMTKRTLQSWSEEHPNTGNVTITRGTDEIAATLISRVIAEQSRFSPRIYVIYSWPGATQVIMPYMPNTVEQTVSEKIALTQGHEVQNPEEADFILYIHIGTPHTPPGVMLHAAKEIKHYLAAGYPVSLVDLSQNYDTHKNLFPYLEKSKIPLNNLLSYNGWNTASNSVGTAIAHAVIFLCGQKNGMLVPERHYAYLFQRFLDDWYFQKQVQPQLNLLLTRKNISPVSLGEHHKTANLIVQKGLMNYADNLYARYFLPKPGEIDNINQMKCQIQLPWPRTFEIQVDVSFTRQ